jgi:hypothetical protein
VTPEAGGRLPAERGSQGSRAGTDPGDTRGGYAAPVPGGAACPARIAAEPVPLPLPNHTDGPTSLPQQHLWSYGVGQVQGSAPAKLFTGSTSSFSGTASGNLAVVAVVRQQVSI